MFTCGMKVHHSKFDKIGEIKRIAQYRKHGKLTKTRILVLWNNQARVHEWFSEAEAEQTLLVA